MLSHSSMQVAAVKLGSTVSSAIRCSKKIAYGFHFRIAVSAQLSTQEIPVADIKLKLIGQRVDL